MLSIEEVRRSFAEFCGQARFVKFVELFNRKARSRRKLLYWQEKLWQEFVDQHPEVAGFSFEDLERVLRICHVHLVPLSDHDVPIERELWDILYSHEYQQACTAQFPYSLDS